MSALGHKQTCPAQTRMSALPSRADIGESSTLFAPDARVVDNATVFFVFAPDMRGEIVEACANRIKTELEKLRSDLRRFDRCSEPGGKLCDDIFRRFCWCHHAEPDLDIVIFVA